MEAFSVVSITEMACGLDKADSATNQSGPT